jgi:hypothetical protein
LAVFALFGWIFIFVTTDPKVILFGLLALALGIAAFLASSARIRQWPFARAER